MAIKCCYKCEERHKLCHSTCERYITEKAEYDEQMKAYKAKQTPMIHIGSFLGDEGLIKYPSGHSRRGRRRKK